MQFLTYCNICNHVIIAINSPYNTLFLSSSIPIFPITQEDAQKIYNFEQKKSSISQISSAPVTQTSPQTSPRVCRSRYNTRQPREVSELAPKTWFRRKTRGAVRVKFPRVGRRSAAARYIYARASGNATLGLGRKASSRSLEVGSRYSPNMTLSLSLGHGGRRRRKYILLRARSRASFGQRQQRRCVSSARAPLSWCGGHPDSLSLALLARAGLGCG